MRQLHLIKPHITLCTIAAFTILVLLGCTQENPPPTQTRTPEAAPLSTLRPTATEIPGINPETPTPKSTMANQATSILPPTSTTVMPTETPLLATSAADNFSMLPIEQHCSSQDVSENIGAEIAAGLMLFGNWGEQRTVGILGFEGLASPQYLLSAESHFSGESPDRKTFTQFVGNGELRIALINAASLQTLAEGLFENIDLAFSIRPMRWVVEERIVIALANEGELFRWLVWSPFEDSREIIEVELEGFGSVRERYRTAVSFDPFLEFIIYPCEDCLPNEYLVKNMRSGETEWSIDLGEKPGSAFRGFPHWSPDGQYIAMVSGDFERTTWIFNRQGVIVHRLEGGSLNMSWSPDSRYLAFGRDNENPLEGDNYSVTLLDLVDNTIIDLCVYPEPPSVPLYWSSDSTKIAIDNRVYELDNPRTLIQIVDINSGDILELSSDEEYYRIEGWVNLDSGEP